MGKQNEVKVKVKAKIKLITSMTSLTLFVA